MDNRRLIIATLIAMLVVPIWMIGHRWLGERLGYDMSPLPPATQPVVEAAPEQTTQTAAPTTSPATITASAPAVGEGELHVIAGIEDSPIKIGSDAVKDPNFRMGVTLRNIGAGIDAVVLNEFKKTADSDAPYVYQIPYPGHEAASRPLATRSIWIDGKEFSLADKLWTLESSDTGSANFTITIARGSTPVLRVRKMLQIASAADDPSRGYEVIVQHAFENLTDQPINVRTSFNGTTLPPAEQGGGIDQQVLGGYTSKGFILVTHNTAGEFASTQTIDLTRDDSNNPVIWAGTNSIYFNALVRPLPTDNSNDIANYIGKVSASAMTTGGTDVVVSFDTVEQTVAPRQTSAIMARAFFGPRNRALLKNPYYSGYPLQYDRTLVLTSGPCAICTFDWLVNMLVVMLAGFHWLFGGFAGHGDWGLAIIALVVVVRVALHPISKKSQIAMAKMGKMAPEMERLKKKYGDDKEQLQKAMMDLYKEQGVAPMLGCLPMLLQMPIWIALWQSLQTTFELRHAPFLWGYTWIDDLSQPDQLLTWAPVEVFFFTVAGLNILPILMGVVFYLQMKFQPKPATMTKEQEQQQKMMMWMMPFLFPIMLYSGPSGLNLYILTSTLIGIIESKKIRDHLKEQEEREKAGRVIVDAGKKFRGGGGKEGQDLKGLGTKPKPPKPTGGLMGWLANLQEKADQIRRETEKKK